MSTPQTKAKALKPIVRDAPGLCVSVDQSRQIWKCKKKKKCSEVVQLCVEATLRGDWPLLAYYAIFGGALFLGGKPVKPDDWFTGTNAF